MALVKKNGFHLIPFIVAVSFLLASCSSLPIIGKKEKKKTEPASDGKTITIEEMENIKGVNPPKAEPPASAKKPPPSQPPPINLPPPKESRTASIPRSPSYSLPPLSFVQMEFKKKVVVLDFENKTTYKEEKIGETVAKKFSDRLESTQRLVVVDPTVVTERLEKLGMKSEKMSSAQMMKHAYQSLGIQAFVSGVVTDVSLLSSKASETSDEEVTFATSKVELQLTDASTGNLLRTFIGRSPIFGTRETGKSSRSNAVLKAIDLCLDEMMEGFLRHVALLDWTTTIAKIEGGSYYINAGRLSGLRIGDTLEVFEPGKEIFHPSTNLSLGWTTGKLKGIVRVTSLFGVDAAVAAGVQGQGFSVDDVVKATSQ